MIKRSINISNKRSFFLFGARGTGKSTLLDQMFNEKDAVFVNLLQPKLFAELQAYPERLAQFIDLAMKDHKSVVIDEIQKVPALLDVVHLYIQKNSTKFALTGSSARKLKRGSANMLAGRASVYHLFPLLYSEIGNEFTLQNALTWGCLPEVVTLGEDNDEKFRLLEAYTETYVNEEIIAEQIVRNLPPFRRFLEVAAQMNACVINASKIASDISTDQSNVRNYFEILEDTLLGFKLDGFHTSIRKRQRKQPKFYWFDSGVLRSLQKKLGTSVNASTAEYGKLFETFLINQIRAVLEYQTSQYKLSYLLTKDGAEIDLIVERAGEKTLCFEIKSGSSVRENELNNLVHLTKDLNGAIPICLYGGHERRLVNGVPVLPWIDGLREYLF